VIETLSFHHLGVACRDLEREERAYAALGYAREGVEFDDAEHGIRGLFLTGPGPRLELLVDRPGEHVIEPWLTKGIAMYHLAFEVSDLETALASRLENGAKLVVRPSPTVAFAGRHVAFVMLRNLTLVELISRV